MRPKPLFETPIAELTGSPVSTMIIERRFEAEPEALERLVEILYRLLMEAPDTHPASGDSGVHGAPGPTCLSPEQEG